MQAEVLAIGDELTSGQRLDTNSQWLSQQLGDLGIRVCYHTSVGDDQAALVKALRTTAKRSTVAVMSGGLGPTADDITRQALAELTGSALRLDSAVLRHIEQRFAQRGRVMPASNQIQAHFPVGSRVIPNPHGTAPGIDLEVEQPEGNRCRLFALPGVPAEMKQMWQQTVQPALEAIRGPGRVITHHELKCFGAGESELEAMLPNLIRRGRQPQVGITVHRATITLRVTAEDSDRQRCWQQMQPTLEIIRDKLGVLVFGEGDDELQDAVIRLLRDRQQTVSVCEWGTRGLVTHWLQCADRIDSPVLRGAVVVSSPNELATWFAGSETAHQGAGHSEELVGWMAQAVRSRCGTDYGLAIGPLPAPNAPQPTIALGLANANRLQVSSPSYTGHPDLLLERTAKQALDLLRRELISYQPPEALTDARS